MNPSECEITRTTPDAKVLTRTTPKPQSYGRVMGKYGGAITALWYAKQLDFEKENTESIGKKQPKSRCLKTIFVWAK